MYVESDDPKKQPKRARVPQMAVQWLMNQLEVQGNSMSQLEGMEQSTMAQMARMMQKQQQLQQAGPQPVQQRQY